MDRPASRCRLITTQHLAAGQMIGPPTGLATAGRDGGGFVLSLPPRKAIPTPTAIAATMIKRLRLKLDRDGEVWKDLSRKDCWGAVAGGVGAALLYG